MPFLPDSRQYRSFAASNFKPVDRDLKLDEDGNPIKEDEPSYRIRGYFTTFNEEYELYPAMPSLDWPAEYEQIDRHAFDNCDLSDVIVQYDHEGDVLARTRNRSLVVGFDEHGGWCEIYLGGCQRGRELYESVCNDLITEMSFGFMIADDDDGVGRVTTRAEDGTYHTTITRVSKMFDASIVSRPANPGTSVDEIRKRSYLAGTIEADRKAAEQERIEQEQALAAQEAAQAEEEARMARESMMRRKRRARALRLSQI